MRKQMSTLHEIFERGISDLSVELCCVVQHTQHLELLGVIVEGRYVGHQKHSYEDCCSFHPSMQGLSNCKRWKHSRKGLFVEDEDKRLTDSDHQRHGRCGQEHCKSKRTLQSISISNNWTIPKSVVSEKAWRRSERYVRRGLSGNAFEPKQEAEWITWSFVKPTFKFTPTNNGEWIIFLKRFWGET